MLLPEALAESISDRSLCDVLVHECAHVLRRDAWVGLLQRLAGALFWPHPFVHYLNGQLTRAREEVCDNHVLQSGDPCGYARTLLALTTVYPPLGVARPGLGLLAARWTLTDRVAGLLDPGRISVTRTSLRIKLAMAIALGVTGISAASVRIGNSAQVDEPKGAQEDLKITSPATPDADFLNIEGVVVDEQGRPVAGATVRTMPLGYRPANIEKTAADGEFRFTSRAQARAALWDSWPKPTLGHVWGWTIRFAQRLAYRINEGVRIVLKPSRPVIVRVRTADGQPVPGATVEAAEMLFRTDATAGPDGTATLRIPADAHVDWVVGFQPRIGFDYFENYQKKALNEAGPLPDMVMLTLDGAQACASRRSIQTASRCRHCDQTTTPLPDREKRQC